MEGVLRGCDVTVCWQLPHRDWMMFRDVMVWGAMVNSYREMIGG